MSVVNTTVSAIRIGAITPPGPYDANSNIVTGNFIGLRADGSTPGGSLTYGIEIMNGGSADNNVIGGSLPADRNVISDNQDGGILMNNSLGTRITNNYIGTNAAGVLARPNGFAGIFINQAANSVIEGNLISANHRGVHISGNLATGNVLQGNTIGLSAIGGSLGNNNFGVELAFGASDNWIGGAANPPKLTLNTA